jgi:hypothetical protein
MSNVPEGAQLSDDGQYWWDGETWQPVEGANDPNDPNSPGATEPAQITPEELEPVGDQGVEPGDENLLDERLKPYFEPDYDGVEDDYSFAEQAETMDDSQYTGNNEGGN